MKTVVFHGLGDIRLDDIPEPQIEQPTDAFVRITTAAICGTDLHFVRGTAPGMRPGQTIGSESNQQDGHWKPGDAPTQVHSWAVESLAKAGTLGIVGVYPQTDMFFPIGTVLNRNLRINAGNGNHPRYIPRLLKMVKTGEVHPEKVLTEHEPLHDVLHAYEQFDVRNPGWLKVALDPSC